MMMGIGGIFMAMMPTELHDRTIASTKHCTATIVTILLLVHRWAWIIHADNLTIVG